MNSITQPKSLSTGVKAGIAVGAAVIALLAIVGGALWYRRRNAKSVARLAHVGFVDKAELPGEGVHRELDGNDLLREMDESVKPPGVQENPAELDGDWRGYEVNALNGR